MRNIFSTLYVGWTVDLKPDTEDGELKPVQVQAANLAEDTLELIKRDIKNLTTPPETVDQPEE